MGSIGGLLGLGGGAGGTGFDPKSGTNPQQLADALKNAQNAVGNQTQVYNQFQNVAAGQGPNPAQAMLNQATGQNVAQQGALQAGQRGAAQNVGLIARQAGQQGMQAQQQAAGQGASMQAQQALGALGQAGQMATGITGAQQNEQQILQNANSAAEGVQGQLANTSMQGQQGLIGGVMNGVGSVLGLARGGEVQRFALGGGTGFNTLSNAPASPIQPSGPQSAFAQSLASPAIPQFSSSNSGAQAMSNSMKGPGKQKPDKMGQANDPKMMQQGQNQSNQMLAPGVSNGMGSSTGGGPIPTNGGYIDPNETDQTFVAANGGNVGDKLKGGGHVPGKPAVKGNSYKNDTVKALLSPGEVVIPKSVMEGGDPVRGSADFVRAVLAKKGKLS